MAIIPPTKESFEEMSFDQKKKIKEKLMLDNFRALCESISPHTMADFARHIEKGKLEELGLSRNHNCRARVMEDLLLDASHSLKRDPAWWEVLDDVLMDSGCKDLYYALNPWNRPQDDPTPDGGLEERFLNDQVPMTDRPASSACENTPDTTSPRADPGPMEPGLVLGTMSQPEDIKVLYDRNRRASWESIVQNLLQPAVDSSPSPVMPDTKILNCPPALPLPQGHEAQEKDSEEDEGPLGESNSLEIDGPASPHVPAVDHGYPWLTPVVQGSSPHQDVLGHCGAPSLPSTKTQNQVSHVNNTPAQTRGTTVEEIDRIPIPVSEAVTSPPQLIDSKLQAGVEGDEDSTPSPPDSYHPPAWDIEAHAVRPKHLHVAEGGGEMESEATENESASTEEGVAPEQDTKDEDTCGGDRDVCLAERARGLPCPLPQPHIAPGRSQEAASAEVEKEGALLKSEIPAVPTVGSLDAGRVHAHINAQQAAASSPANNQCQHQPPHLQQPELLQPQQPQPQPQEEEGGFVRRLFHVFALVKEAVLNLE